VTGRSGPDELLDALDLFAGYGDTGPAPVDWSALDGSTAANAWQQLDAWVRWLVTRYLLDHRDVPACWYQHTDLVEELSALRTAHRAAFDARGTAHGPLDWHQQLASSRQRLQTAVARTGCRPDEHRTHPLPAWATNPGHMAAFAHHVARDVAARGGAEN
jgi:hypothetical protein